MLVVRFIAYFKICFRKTVDKYSNFSKLFDIDDFFFEKILNFKNFWVIDRYLLTNCKLHT